MGNSRFIGTVKWFSAKKGFGFIVAKVSEGTDEQEIFVHQTSIVDADEQGFRTLVRALHSSSTLKKVSLSASYNNIYMLLFSSLSFPRSRLDRSSNFSPNKAPPMVS
jgi:cold shock CspA family protein